MNDTPLPEIEAAKRVARAAARAARDAARADAPGVARRAAGHMLEAIAAWRGARVVSAYLPIGSELDTRPLMLALHGLGFTVAVPVVAERAEPLRFRRWRPGVPLAAGPFGVQMPTVGAPKPT